MKHILVAVMAALLLVGCQKSEDMSSTPSPSTNAPATNAPSGGTNAPAQ